MGKSQIRKFVTSAFLIGLVTACSDRNGTTTQSSPSLSASSVDEAATPALLPAADRALIDKSNMKASCKQFARRVLARAQEAIDDNPQDVLAAEKRYQTELRQALVHEEAAVPPKQYDETACQKANDDWNWIMANRDILIRTHLALPDGVFDLGLTVNALKIDYASADDAQPPASVAIDASASDTASAPTSPASSATAEVGSGSSSPQPGQQAAVGTPNGETNDFPCTTSADCYRSLLSAARQEDESAADNIAAALGTLPKHQRGDRQQARAANDRGLAALKDGRFDLAEQNFSQAIVADADDIEATSNLSFTYVQLGDYDKAESLSLTALSLDPRRTSTWAPLAVALAKNGKPDDALEAMWLAYAFSGNKQTTLDFISSKADAESDPIVKAMYTKSYAWLAQHQKPAFSSGD